MKCAARETGALVIGYGNTSRGDDGVGHHTAELLALRNICCEIKACHQLTPELAANIAEASLVIFIDASVELAPGEVKCLPVTRAAGPCPHRTHHCSPQSLLELSHQLYGKSPRAFVFSIGGENFAFSEELSDPVKRTQPQLIRQIEELIHA